MTQIIVENCFNVKCLAEYLNNTSNNEKIEFTLSRWQLTPFETNNLYNLGCFMLFAETEPMQKKNYCRADENVGKIDTVWEVWFWVSLIIIGVLVDIWPENDKH